MPARLSLHTADRPVAVFRLADGGSYLIGRDAACDVQVDDDRVSRRHARLCHDPDAGWSVTDLGSKNGLSLEGRAIENSHLQTAAWLGFGGVFARFEPLHEADLRAEAAAELERRRSGFGWLRRLDPAAGFEPLLDRVLESVTSMAGTERGFLLLARGDGGPELVRAVGLDPEELADEAFVGSVGAVEQTLSEGRPVVCCDASADTLLGGRPSVVRGGIRALVCVPLVAAGRLLGVVYTDSRQPGRAFTELDLEILQGLASHAALALAVAGLRREVSGLEKRLPSPSPSWWDGARHWRELTAGHRAAAPEGREVDR